MDPRTTCTAAARPLARALFRVVATARPERSTPTPTRAPAATPASRSTPEPQPTSKSRGPGSSARVSARSSRHRRVVGWPGGKVEAAASTSTRSPGRGR